MESQPQNPEFRDNPENFHPWLCDLQDIHSGENCIQIKFPSVEVSHLIYSHKFSL